MALDRDPNHVLRDFVIPGMPSSGKWNVHKPEFRALLTEWWQTLIALVADAGGLELPNLLISMTVDPDEGDENAIVAEANLPVPSGPGLAVFSIVIEEANTGPVTINGKPLLSNTGNPLMAGALAADGIYLFLDNGDSYRLLSDYVSSSIVATTEAAASEAIDASGVAVDAAQRAEDAASSVEFPVSYVPQSLTAAQRTQARANIGRNNYVTPQDFGAVGDGVADDTAALQATLDAANSLGISVDFGGASSEYRFTSRIQLTLANDLYWFSKGAKLRFDGAAQSVLSPISISNTDYNVLTAGDLTLDCSDRTASGFMLMAGSASTGLGSCSIEGLTVNNCYMTASTPALSGAGNGIYVTGQWRAVWIDRCDVRGVKLSADATGTDDDGVAGISVLRNSLNSTDARKISITRCVVEDVWCEDLNRNTVAMNGIRAFSVIQGSSIPSLADISLHNNQFINCMGRAIKVQGDSPDVSDIKIIRTGKFGNFVGTKPDIDLQTAGGSVRGVKCHYQSNFPERVVHCHISRYENHWVQNGLFVSDINLLQLGVGNGISEIVSVSSTEATYVGVKVDGVAMHGAKLANSVLSLNSSKAVPFLATVTNIAARVSGQIVRRSSPATHPVDITGMAISNTSSVPLWTAAVEGGVNASLVGQNRNITLP